MSHLEKLQQSFLKAIFDSSKQVNFIKSDHPKERLAIYRQTILENMRNSLNLTFPGIWKLLGNECANSVAYAFCRSKKNLPSSGCLDDWGSNFPAFLSSLKELEHLFYLEDYAHYEWVRHLAYGAKSASAIHVQSFSNIPEQQIESIKFSFLPSVFLVYSKFPIQEINDMLNNSKSEAIQLSSNKNFGVILRIDNQVTTLWTQEDLWHFIKYLQQNLSLKQTITKLKTKFPNFNLTNSIYFLLDKQLIAKIILKE